MKRQCHTLSDAVASTTVSEREAGVRVFILVTALTLWPFTNALAQNTEVGRAIAAETCSRCHAVLRGQGVDPNPEPLPFKEIGKPLPFEDIANMPNANDVALYDWLT